MRQTNQRARVAKDAQPRAPWRLGLACGLTLALPLAYAVEAGEGAAPAPSNAEGPADAQPADAQPADAAAAAPAAAEPQAAPATLHERMGALAPLLDARRGAKGFPRLSKGDLKKVESGQVVLREFAQAGSEVPRTVLAKVLPYPVEALYLVVADLVGQQSWVPGLSASVVVGKEQGGLVLHGFQLMKAPTNDRAWVTRVANNKDLFEASAGKYWEIWWRLLPEEMDKFRWEHLSQDPARRALVASIDDKTLKNVVYPLFSDGAWVMMPLGPDRTYVEYDSFTDPRLTGLEQATAMLFGAAVMKDMLVDLEPLAKGYATGARRPPAGMVDMVGQPVAGLVETLKAASR